MKKPNENNKKHQEDSEEAGGASGDCSPSSPSSLPSGVCTSDVAAVFRRSAEPEGRKVKSLGSMARDNTTNASLAEELRVAFALREQQKVQLEEKINLAESAEMMLAYMSHEIRNLLFGQQANLDLAVEQLAKLQGRLNEKDEKACSDVRQLLSDACNCSSSIVRVVNDTLDAKRASQFEFLATEARPCLVEDVVGQCAKNVAHKLETKGSNLTLEVIPHCVFEERSDSEDEDEAGDFSEQLEGRRMCFSADDEKKSAQTTPRSPRVLLPSRQYYMGDADRVTQVLANLVSNAIKYSDEKGTISVASEELPGGRVRYLVTDTGPGIAEDIRPRLFKSAYIQSAANNSQTSKTGTGLGLFLCRAIVVDSLGGTIGYEKHAGHGGSVFSFCIPMPKCLAPFEAAARPVIERRHTSDRQMRPSVEPRRHTVGGVLGEIEVDDSSTHPGERRRESSLSNFSTIGSACDLDLGELSRRGGAQDGENCCLKNRRVLVVDDSKINRTVISRALSAAGATVDLAEDGLVALEMITKSSCSSYEMLWTDIEMPRMGGVELVRELRRLPVSMTCRSAGYFFELLFERARVGPSCSSRRETAVSRRGRLA
jgi:signal transduction histidine kinase